MGRSLERWSCANDFPVLKKEGRWSVSVTSNRSKGGKGGGICQFPLLMSPGQSDMAMACTLLSPSQLLRQALSMW